MAQFHPEDRSLKGIEAAVQAQDFVLVLGAAAVKPQQLETICQLRVVRAHHAAVTGTTKVFGRKETETSEVADVAGEPAVIVSADCLRCVFNHGETVGLRNRGDLVHKGGPAEQVDRDDRLRAKSDRWFNLAWVQVVGVGIDVDKNRSCTQACN